MRKAKVLFEYEPQEDDELRLKVGDVILEVEDADVGWCSGVLNGKRGMFPDNFVEIKAEEEKKTPPPPPAGNKKPSVKKNVRQMKITFPYTADGADELSLEVGEIIEILKDVEEGWAEGLKSNGKKGVFPTNFGDMMEENAEPEDSVDEAFATAQEEEENKPDEEAPASQKRVKGIGFGNIFGDGPIKLRQKSIGESDRKKNLSTPPAKPAAVKEKEPAKDVMLAKPKKTLSYCRVMFDYAKDNDDELGLMKGEIVVILSKAPGDDGWWEGEREENGKRVKGVFPDNFVVELTPDEAKEYEKQQQNKSETPKEAKAMTLPNKELKKVTPLMPAPPSQSAKPVVNSDGATNHTSDLGLSELSVTEHTLAHVKRPAGPKNRRKPGAAERREKAAASQIYETNDDEESEEEVKAEPVPAKKESVKRGVAVLPGMGGAGDAPTGETPSWLQNLRSRQSMKKPPPAAPTKEPAAETQVAPPWLANLKKRQSSEFPDKVSAAPTKEKTALQPKVPPEKPKPPNGQAPGVPPTKPAGPKPAQKSTSPADKPLAAWQIERQHKSKTKSSESNEEKAPDLPDQQPYAAPSTETAPPPTWKNSLSRKAPSTVKSPEPQAPTAIKKPDKPPIGTPVATPVSGVRAKPAPPKGKPAPAVKPASSSAVEELKSEVKNLKEEMEKMKKDILRLNSELQSEREHRVSLQEEVHKLRNQVSL